MRHAIALAVLLAFSAQASTEKPPDRSKGASCDCAALFKARDLGKLESKLDDLLAEDASDEAGQPLALFCLGVFGGSLTADDVAALDAWTRAAPESHAAHLIAGQAWLSRGVKARGTGYSDKVSGAQFDELFRDSRRARELLLRAEAIKPQDPMAPTLLMKALVYLQAPEKDVFDAFARAVALRPEWTPSYSALLWYLDPRWSGDAARFLRVARAVRDARPSNPNLMVSVANAHFDSRWYRKDDAYFRDPAVWAETRDAYLTYLSIRPYRENTWGRLARMAWEARDNDTLVLAAREFSSRIEDTDVEIDGIRMQPVVDYAARVSAARRGNGTEREPRWTRVPMGPGGRAVADATLRALRARPSPP